ARAGEHRRRAGREIQYEGRLPPLRSIAERTIANRHVRRGWPSRDQHGGGPWARIFDRYQRDQRAAWRYQTRINDLDGRTTKALNGVSMAFAMGGTPWLLPTERFAVSMDWGTFQGTNAVAINGAFRLGTNVQANGGLAYGANGGGAGGRAGVRVGW